MGHGQEVLSALLDVVIPVFAIAAIGFVYASRKAFPVHVITDLIIHVTGACLIFDALSSADRLTFDAARVPLSAALVILGCIGLALFAHRFVPALRALPRGAVVLPAAFMNAANLGLPMAKLTLGAPGLEAAMLVFVTFNILLLSVGVGFIAGQSALKVVLTLPILHAAWLGILANQLELSIPVTLKVPIHMLGQTVIPTMLLALGARLRGLLVTHRGRFSSLQPVFLIVGIRLFGGIGMATLVNFALGNEGVVRSVTLLSGFLPSAVMSFALVEKYGNDEHASSVVSASIAFGTGIAVLTLPVWVMLVR